MNEKLSWEQTPGYLIIDHSVETWLSICLPLIDYSCILFCAKSSFLLSYLKIKHFCVLYECLTQWWQGSCLPQLDLVKNPLILDRCISQLSDSVRGGNCVHLYNVCCMHMCLLWSLFWHCKCRRRNYKLDAKVMTIKMSCLIAWFFVFFLWPESHPFIA